MGNIVSLCDFRNKKSEKENNNSKLNEAIKYLQTNPPTSKKLDVQVFLHLSGKVRETGSKCLVFKVSQIAKEFGTTSYMIKKALGVLIDNGLVAIVTNHKGKPLVISVEGGYLAYNCMKGNQRKLN